MLVSTMDQMTVSSPSSPELDIGFLKPPDIQYQPQKIQHRLLNQWQPCPLSFTSPVDVGGVHNKLL